LSTKIKTIIIADDDIDDMDFLEQALEKSCSDYRYHKAHSGMEVFTLLNKIETPDLIILDINMPKMNGIECLQQLKSKKETASIPVVILTTASPYLVKDACLNLGAAAFFTKADNFNQIELMVSKICAEFLV
jgi:PleD family two-component response regulator